MLFLHLRYTCSLNRGEPLGLDNGVLALCFLAGTRSSAFLERHGGLEFVDGISAPGNYVDVTADMDVLFVISNCPQVNNPCNGFNPTPIRVVVRDAPGL